MFFIFFSNITQDFLAFIVELIVLLYRLSTSVYFIRSVFITTAGAYLVNCFGTVDSAIVQINDVDK